MEAGLNLGFEPARVDDADALVAIRIAAMRDSLERLGRFDPARARARFLDGFDPVHTRHVVVDGERVGFVVVKPDGDDLLLDHLYVLPAHQGRGVGAAVLADVLAHADARHARVRLGALRASDANRFYARHGFAVVGESEWDIHYARPPAR